MEHIKNAFDNIAAEYDSQRQYVIPEMDEYYGAAVWAAESPENTPAILDIGAGTGLLSALMLQKFPGATLTLLDISENMLAVARQRFSGRKNIRYIVNDYSRAELEGPYDIVCSALSIHHLANEDKFKLFEKIYSALKPGGMFINADQADGETLYFRQRYLDYWNQFLKSGPLNEKVHVEILTRRDILDRNEKLSVQMQWLKECGFYEVDVVFKNRTFIVTVARKA
ncbi:MAG: class I SAM-dependent methyltransferase [Methanoregula sp.]|jgi:tRNA (cmo5U34)-methyltransferase|nr:class I SAM-dependent methyltransferase [Methanoregula sp.]